MSQFTDVLHRVASIGEHVIEYVEGHTEVRVNGIPVDAAHLAEFIRLLTEAAAGVGVVVRLAEAAA